MFGFHVIFGEGLWAEMIAWAISECCDRGCGLVQLTSDKKREDAIQFMKGFCEISRVKVY